MALDKQRLFQQVTGAEEQVEKLYREINHLKDAVVELLEENKNLLLENQHLRARLQKTGDLRKFRKRKIKSTTPLEKDMII